MKQGSHFGSNSSKIRPTVLVQKPIKKVSTSKNEVRIRPVLADKPTLLQA
jgi:hypothetical protein